MDNDKLEAALERLDEEDGRTPTFEEVMQEPWPDEQLDPHARAMAAGLAATEAALEIGHPELLPPQGVRALSDKAILELLRGDARLNRIRRIFSNWSAKIEQAGLQRKPLTTIQARRLEFEAAEELIREALR